MDTFPSTRPTGFFTKIITDPIDGKIHMKFMTMKNMAISALVPISFPAGGCPSSMSDIAQKSDTSRKLSTTPIDAQILPRLQAIIYPHCKYS